MKTIKRIGTISLGAFIGLVFCLVWLLHIPPAEAAYTDTTWPSRTLTIPITNSGVTATNPYFILYDVATGFPVNATTGIAATDVTWANAAFDEGHYTADDITGWPNFTIPALPKGIKYGIVTFDGASPAATDTAIAKGFYNAAKGFFYTDVVPVMEDAVVTVPVSAINP